MTKLKSKLILPLALSLSLAQTALGQASEVFLVCRGQPQAVILAAKSPQYNFSSHELQRYFEALSGARLEIVPVESAKQNQRNVAFSLLGGTDANDLIKDPTAMRLVQLDGLKRGGFVLRSCEYDGHHALVVTGNDAPSTRYAVYDLQAEYSITTVRTECIFRVAEPDVTPNRSSG